MHHKDSVNVCSFNCRSAKKSFMEIKELCDSHDIVLLQEHWLFNHELHLLNNVHREFNSVALSAIDTTSDIVIGRPYGGTAILYRKVVAHDVQLVQTDESRITGIILETVTGPLLILNVYMPTNYCDVDSAQLYLNCLSKLHAIILDFCSVDILIAGDFNCCVGSKFYKYFEDFVSDNNFVLSDFNHLSNAVTYISDDGSRRSWIDHVISTSSVDKLISDMSVLMEYVCSDHKPLSFKIACNISGFNSVRNLAFESSLPCNIPDWNNCDDFMFVRYAEMLDSCLQNVHVPFEAFTNSSSIARDNINVFYNCIESSIQHAVNLCIPQRQVRACEFNVPGWNTYVSERHETARAHFKDWVYNGKPKHGPVYEGMKQTRALFKLSLRHCRSNIEQIKADACTVSLVNKEPRKFWNEVYKLGNSKTTNHVVTVGGATGKQEIADMWKTNFERLYGSGGSSPHRNSFMQKVATLPESNDLTFISVQDVQTVIAHQKLGKAPGPDNIHMEAYIHGGQRLSCYITFLFNLCLKHGYVPDSFNHSVLIPLVKNKTGDVSCVDNYRAIALSQSVTKLLEGIIMRFIESYDACDVHQFGFVKQQSTATCTYVFKKVVKYYTERGSHVFACFIDFRKAFDNVDYWLLFCKLWDSGLEYYGLLATRLLASWYSSQLMCVKWLDVFSCNFSICNGVRQGGILSPFLFRFYLRDLIRRIANCKFGCNIASVFVNILAYADDIVLLAPSWRALQCLLNLTEQCASDLKMLFNTDKSVCMVFNPSQRNKIVASHFPCFVLQDKFLSFVSHFKYLGHIIENNLADNCDIKREIKSMFFRTNILIRRFKRCSSLVKLQLFRTFAICFYDMCLWMHFTKGTLEKLALCYGKCVKIFFGYSVYSSTTAVLFETGLPSFSTLLHNAIAGFRSRVAINVNSIVQVASLY